MVGPDTYVLHPQISDGKLTANGMKALMIKQAEGYCEEQGRQLQQVVNLSRENAVGAYAAPELQFKCMTARR